MPACAGRVSASVARSLLTGAMWRQPWRPSSSAIIAAVAVRIRVRMFNLRQADGIAGTRAAGVRSCMLVPPSAQTNMPVAPSSGRQTDRQNDRQRRPTWATALRESVRNVVASPIAGATQDALSQACLLPAKTRSMTPARDIARLLEIMAALRTPNTGCPWDLAQNFPRRSRLYHDRRGLPARSPTRSRAMISTTCATSSAISCCRSSSTRAWRRSKGRSSSPTWSRRSRQN